jgi:predicted TIM-barrel fold metal-dependent hydrolase
MVQVVLGGGTQIPLGQERYWPIYEAAVEAGLPVAIHAGAEGYGVAYPNSGAGYPSTYLERQSVQPCNAMGQLMSLVLEGVPVEFPEVRFVLVGYGYGWLPSFCWRADKNWKGPSQDVPWVERPPSEYVSEHVSVVTGRIDEADSPTNFRRTFEMVDGDELLVYGSGYPHWDYHVPESGALDLEPSALDSVFGGNASALYGW